MWLLSWRSALWRNHPQAPEALEMWDTSRREQLFWIMLLWSTGWTYRSQQPETQDLGHGDCMFFFQCAPSHVFANKDTGCTWLYFARAAQQYWVWCCMWWSAHVDETSRQDRTSFCTCWHFSSFYVIFDWSKHNAGFGHDSSAYIVGSEASAINTHARPP